MSEVLVVGEPEQVEGFALAGARVDSTRDPERVAWLLREAILRRAPAVVAVTESLYEGLPEKIRLAAESSGRPMVITLPRPAGWEALEGGDNLIARIIRRAIGYRIKVRR